ncbi:uncharacterized protein zgc:113276 isoform X2 [Tachysurus fulvidraco]|uniref:uncharacterized protein zgc:113276 isoform X2 n=1 Tax=Tachysurus fulvidraco TaxID=1234273 RepID=UPI001FED96EC|nr:uncharacterized protein zgc:113276 isoform X2 [Tachysurus fulvidraco]
MLDVLIVGAGPHALILATLLMNPNQHVNTSSPEILQGVQLSKTNPKTGQTKSKNRSVDTLSELHKDPKCPACPPLIFKVVDSYGEWASLWESQFTTLNIPHLRSHMLVHTNPLNKKALQEFVLAEDRLAELHSLPEKVYIQDKNAFFNDGRLGKQNSKLLSAAKGLQKNLYFSLPGTQLSVDFFKDQVWGTVDRITPLLSGKEKKVEFFQVTLDTGDTLEAKRVVLATGPTREQMANIPPWVRAITESYPEERLQHTVELMHHLAQHKSEGSRFTGPPAVCHRNQRVMVIGGGLSSAHIISMALQQGANEVTWVLRKHVQLKQFDVGDVESLIGRYSHIEHGIKLDGLAYLRQFYGERSLHRRLAMIKQARKGGAVTPEAYAQLQPFIQSGQLLVKAYCQVTEAVWCYETQKWKVFLDDNGEKWTGDRIWLATGCKLDVNQDPLLSDIKKHFPVQVLEGWPCISETLQWAPACPVYLMGQYAALQVGPHAVNLAGGQAAAFRIAKDIIDEHSRKKKNTENNKVEKTQTEEYISHMHGLMWL